MNSDEYQRSPGILSNCGAVVALCQGTTGYPLGDVPKMVQNHGGLKPLRDFFHIPATVFAVTMVCLNKIDIHLPILGQTGRKPLAADKAHVDFAAVAARLARCPDPEGYPGAQVGHPVSFPGQRYEEGHQGQGEKSGRQSMKRLSLVPIVEAG